MVPSRRAMHVARFILVFVIATVAVASGVRAEPQDPLGPHFSLTNDASPTDGVDVGEEVTITLTFRNKWSMDREVTVTDVNPNPAWFKIVESSIEGGAEYFGPSELREESVVWDNVLNQATTHTVTFRMKVLGGAGRKATNTAILALKVPDQSVPEEVDTADIFIKPSAPVLEEIDNADGDDSYLVEWSEVTGAELYLLEEDDSSDFDSGTTAFSGPESEVVLKDRAPGIWYYRVRAFGIGGTMSQPSNTVSATVVIGVPQLLDIVNPDREPDYLVEWSEVNGATSYTLEEDDNAGFGSPTTRYLGPDEKYQVTDQPEGTWYYRVRANGPGSVTSEWSLPGSTQVGGNLARTAFLPVMVRVWPPVPETPSLQPILNPGGVGGYTVNWSTAARAKTYILEEATAAGFQGASEIYVGADTQFDVVGRGASRLFYRVKSRNPSGESEWSNVRKVDVLWEAEPNDSAGQANGPIVSGLTYFGAFPVGAPDVSDYFYFELPAGRTVEIRLTSIAAGENYDLVLRDTSLNDRGYSGQPGNSDEYINVAVPAGRYLIQVFHRTGSGSSQPYNLQAIYE